MPFPCMGIWERRDKLLVFSVSFRSVAVVTFGTGRVQESSGTASASSTSDFCVFELTTRPLVSAASVVFHGGSS